MANSKYEYVRSFEQPDNLLPNTWIVVRIDGRGFSRFTTKYKFVKPNDRHALDLMNAAAEAVMKELQDLVLAYGNSDEYSFVFHKDCNLFERRASKLITTIVSTFTSYYVFLWSSYFPEKPLTPPLPSFDGRAVCYPSDLNLRDYMSWRQVDCHINNLYNTTFWMLVQQGGMDPRSAEQRLSGTVSSDKNELLFKEFGVNYNKEPECFKKGTVLYRDFFPSVSTEALLLSTSSAFPSPPLAHPQPRRNSPTHTTTQPPESGTELLYGQSKEQDTPGRGPGLSFLSTTSTPSPPPSPSTMSISAIPTPLRAAKIDTPRNIHLPMNDPPISPLSTVTSPYESLIPKQSKQSFASLMPLAISPLTLKPSTKPPTSLGAPNPTTRINLSPTSPPDDFPSAYPISGYNHKGPSAVTRAASHSASASMSAHSSTTSPTLSHQNDIRCRSPSQPQLSPYLSLHRKSASGPPSIPLRISSIPVNSRPRKLSLHNSSNSTLKAVRSSTEEKDTCLHAVQTPGSRTLHKHSSSLRTNKELPMPPSSQDEELRTRRKVKSSENSPEQESMPIFHVKTSLRHRLSEPKKESGRISIERAIAHPGIAELPATSLATPRRGIGHSRAQSASTSASLHYPHHGPDFAALSSCMNATLLATDSTALQPIPSTNSSFETDSLLSTTHSPRNSQALSLETFITKTAPIAKSSGVKSNTSAPLPKDPSKPSLSTAKRSGNTSNRSGQHNSKGNKSDKTPIQHGRLSAAIQYQQCTSSGPLVTSRTQRDKDRKKRSKAKIVIEHVDIIKDEFWEKRPWILSGRAE